MPLTIAASARQTASPPSAASWTSEQSGAVRQRNAIRRASAGEIERRGPARELAVERLVLGAVERQRGLAGEEDRVALAPRAGDGADVRDEPDAADHRRRVDRPSVRLVVERDVAGDDRDAERLAGLRDALDRLGQLPRRSRGFSGLPKLRQSVTASGSPPAQATLRAASSTASAPPVRGSSRPIRPVPSSETARPRVPSEPQHGGVEPGAADGARADEVVVAVVDPGAAAEVRRARAARASASPSGGPATGGAGGCGSRGRAAAPGSAAPPP